jgi:hypothetical protein
MSSATEHGLGEASDLFTVFRGSARARRPDRRGARVMLRQGSSGTWQRGTPRLSRLHRVRRPVSRRTSPRPRRRERILEPNRPTIDHMFEAELWRLKGDLLLARARVRSPQTQRRGRTRHARWRGRFARARHESAPGVRAPRAARAVSLTRPGGSAAMSRKHGRCSHRSSPASERIRHADLRSRVGSCERSKARSRADSCSAARARAGRGARSQAGRRNHEGVTPTQRPPLWVGR